MNTRWPLSLTTPFPPALDAIEASWHPEGPGRTRGQIAAMAAAVHRRLAADERRHWVIADEDAGRFLAGLLGVLAAGRTAVLPQHFGREAVAMHLGDDCGLVGARGAFADLDAIDPGSGIEHSTAEGPPPDIDPEARLILYTSGSTGEPKAVPKALWQLTAEIEVLEATWGPSLGDAAVVTTLPHHHLYGLLFRLLWPFCAGRRFPDQALLEPPRMVAACRQLGPSLLASSPAHLGRWTSFSGLAASDVDLRAIYSSAGALPAATAGTLRRSLDVPVREIYGSTESGGIAWREWELTREGDVAASAWRLFDGVETAYPDGSPGPLHVRSLACGDIWLDTGDRAEVGEEGFRLLGRQDGVVKIEDRRVSLAELEAGLRASDLVEEAAVLHLHNGREMTAAALVLTESGRRLLDEGGGWSMRQRLRHLLAERFNEVVIPRKFRYLDALPRNSMGKLQRQSLEALFSEEKVRARDSKTRGGS